MTDQQYHGRLRRMGLKIAYYRKLRGFTQEQMAEMLGISWSTVSKIETGLTGLSLRLLWDMAACLRIPPGKMLDDDEE